MTLRPGKMRPAHIIYLLGKPSFMETRTNAHLALIKSIKIYYLSDSISSEANDNVALGVGYNFGDGEP